MGEEATWQCRTLENIPVEAIYSLLEIKAIYFDESFRTINFKDYDPKFDDDPKIELMEYRIEKTNKRHKIIHFNCEICDRSVSVGLRVDLSEFSFLCRGCKRKKTCLEKYGVEYISKNQNIKERRKQTCLKKYGVDHPSKIPEIAKKISNKREKTCLERYGRKSPPPNTQKIKQTCLERYGVENCINIPGSIEKRRQTWLNNYGVDNPIKNQTVFEKRKQSWRERRGYDNPFADRNIIENSKTKRKQTCMDKYGVSSILKDPIIKNRAAENRRKIFLSKYGVNTPRKIPEVIRKSKERRKITWLGKYGVDNPSKDPAIYEKIKTQREKTCLDKYGVDNPWKDPNTHKQNVFKTKETCIRKYGVDSVMKVESIKEKILDTKRKNNTFNTSRPEERLYEILRSKYTNVIRRYSDRDRYPFSCDFYIPEKDLFIELNAHWTHGKKAFDPTNQNHLDEFKLWESKINEHPFYKVAIEVWTVRDPLKRKIAKENNLNYIEIFDLKRSKHI